MNQEPKDEPRSGSLDALLEVLADAFSQVQNSRRELEDQCVHKEDEQRARMRSCICMDIAEALRIAAKSTSNVKDTNPDPRKP